MTNPYLRGFPPLKPRIAIRAKLIETKHKAIVRQKRYAQGFLKAGTFEDPYMRSHWYRRFERLPNIARDRADGWPF